MKKTQKTLSKKYDYSMLNGEMRKKRITQGKLAETIGVSEATLNKKLNNKSQFTQMQMTKILAVLGLPLSDIETYFFCSETCENASEN